MTNSEGGGVRLAKPADGACVKYLVMGRETGLGFYCFSVGSGFESC